MLQTKKRWFFLLLLPVFVGGLYLVSGEGFLPWMRYRSVPEWSTEEVHYQLQVEHATDTTYRVLVLAPRTNRRVLVTWLGDSTRVMRYHDAFYKLGAEGDLVALDTSIVTVSGNHLIPLRVGVTSVLVKLPTGIDTLFVTVESEGGILAVYGRQEAVR